MVFIWPPLKNPFKLRVLIPSSNLEISSTLREKTEFIGRIARAAAIFKVDELVVLDDSPENTPIFIAILKYLLTSPYLRKKLIPLTKELRYAGLLPPLNIVTHNPENKQLSLGDLREGLVKVSWGRGAKVFIGAKEDCILRCKRKISPNERVIVRVININPLRCEEVSPSEIPEYTGFKVSSINTERINKILKGVIIITSKQGRELGKGLLKAIESDIAEKGEITILFGNSFFDFDEILVKIAADKRSSVIENIKYRVNSIPGQGVLSVRTDEALTATLAIFNSYLRMGRRFKGKT
jgi:predicted SPOUT superfamily RNA methylase MTH1